MLKLQFFPLYPRATISLALNRRWWQPDGETKKFKQRLDRGALFGGLSLIKIGYGPFASS